MRPGCVFKEEGGWGGVLLERLRYSIPIPRLPSVLLVLQILIYLDCIEPHLIT